MTYPWLCWCWVVVVASESSGHTPVLTKAVRELIPLSEGEVVLDATVGLGGHARLFAESLGASGLLVGLDVDPANLARARQALDNVPCRVELIHANFTEARMALTSVGVSKVDVMFADLGVSSTQLDDGERGFSFQRDGPLDMRMDPRLTKTAADIVNRLKDRPLGDLLYYNAQETASRRIAKMICDVRREKRITTTGELAAIVARAVGVDPASHKAKIHPATRTFQALRIAVNAEIESLAALLETAPDLLNPGGRIGIIAFHSLEDKPVKLDFRRRKGEGIYRVVTKKPVIADAEERRDNPRARSAKLRVAVRLPENEDSTGSLD